jgi:hypothetical protein
MRIRDSPRDRLKEVTLGLLSHKSGPNVILGVFVTALLQSLTGRAPLWWAGVSGVAWGLSVIGYAVADGIKARIEEQKRQLLSDESDYRGIE